MSIPDPIISPAVRLADDSAEWYLAMSFGRVSGYTRVSGIGYNPDVDTGTTPEDAWGGAGLYPWLAASTSLEMVSTSASDAAAGVGARTVSVTGLDANYLQVTQTITLNGVTAVAIPLPLFRINSIRVLTSGTSLFNVGDILVRDAGAGATRGIILVGIGVVNQAPYTVPAGFTLGVRQILLSVDSDAGTINKFASIRTYFKSPTGAPILSLPLGNTNGSSYNHLAEPLVMVPEKNDFSLRIMKASDNNTAVTCAWNGILRANT